MTQSPHVTGLLIHVPCRAPIHVRYEVRLRTEERRNGLVSTPWYMPATRPVSPRNGPRIRPQSLAFYAVNAEDALASEARECREEHERKNGICGY
jgi:hypothetical protein